MLNASTERWYFLVLAKVHIYYSNLQLYANNPVIFYGYYAGILINKTVYITLWNSL